MIRGLTVKFVKSSR